MDLLERREVRMIQEARTLEAHCGRTDGKWNCHEESCACPCAACMAINRRLRWEQKSEYGQRYQEAQLGTPEDGVRFFLMFATTCYRRGKWRLLIEVCGGENHARWGCFDDQDQPLRYYHKEENAKSEAEELARVLWADRFQKSPL